MVNGSVDVFPEHERDDFTLGVLQRTSGSVCPRVESSLWDFSIGGSSPEETPLIAHHLEHCTRCRTLAEDLACLQEVLPSMADLEPGPSFTNGVLALTSGRSRRRAELRGRIVSWWNQMVERPLFSLEAAYLGTLILFFAFSPYLPLRDLVFRRLPSSAIQPSANYLASIWVDAKDPVSGEMQKLASTAARSGQAVSESLGELTRDSQGAMTTSLYEIQAWRRESAADLRTFWRRVFDRPPPKIGQK
jgi:hypothetical protein